MNATLVRRSKLAKALGVAPASIEKLVTAGVIPPQLPGTSFWVLENVVSKLVCGPTPPPSATTSAFDQWKRSRDARSA